MNWKEQIYLLYGAQTHNIKFTIEELAPMGPSSIQLGYKYHLKEDLSLSRQWGWIQFLSKQLKPGKRKSIKEISWRRKFSTSSWVG
jgi:hypothetical protein